MLDQVKADHREDLARSQVLAVLIDEAEAADEIEVCETAEQAAD